LSELISVFLTNEIDSAELAVNVPLSNTPLASISYGCEVSSPGVSSENGNFSEASSVRMSRSEWNHMPSTSSASVGRKATEIEAPSRSRSSSRSVA
jgi:hypothetical protein